MKTDRKEMIKQLGEYYEKLLVVPAGSIDSDINIKPQGHIHYAS
jgi:hypothetical protein